jgi:hypothetical protein
MLENRFVLQFPAALGQAVVLADYHRKLAAGVAQDWGSIHTLNSIKEEGSPGTYSVV